LSESELRYTCPSCSESFTISLDRIPPVRARFPCEKCGEPMDFPSREQARIQAKLQAQAARRESEAEVPKVATDATDGKPFRLDKRGWEDDHFTRRDVRNLIRTGEILPTDHMFIANRAWVLASDVPELKSLFDLKKASKRTPPRCCRTHTDRLAHFLCHDTDRPLCEECAPEKKINENTTVRTCAHCGGATDITAGALTP
jgi:ribosomal protein L37AE/L43A